MPRESKRSGGARGKSGQAAETAEAAPKVDAVLGDLERVVDELESGELPLEEALARFETGVRLAKDGARMLDHMERRVEVLLADGDDDTRVPFESSENARATGDDDDDEL